MTTLPLLYVLGDSISIQYGPSLEKNLRGSFRYDRKKGVSQALRNLDIPEGANAGDSRMALAFLREFLNEDSVRPDLLLFNCGLHDIKRSWADDRIQVPLPDYEQNLRGMIRLGREKGIRLFWVRSTAVVDRIHHEGNREFARYERDLAAYNGAADEVMKEAGVPLLDLHAFTLALGPVDELFCDHVHYREWVREKQGAFLAERIKELGAPGC